MHYNIVHLATLIAAADATYIRKWNLQGCPNGGVSQRCNSLPAGRCCEQGRVQGGSVRIANMPSYVDIAVPYSGRNGGGSNGQTRCNTPKLNQVRFGDINCCSNPRIGTGLWIHCSRSLSANQCISMSSAPHNKRDVDEIPQALKDFNPNHPGYISEAEADLPPLSYHGLNGEQISEEQFNRMSDLEIAHEANGTLHLLYPDHYPANYLDWYPSPTDETAAEEPEELAILDFPGADSAAPSAANPILPPSHHHHHQQ